MRGSVLVHVDCALFFSVFTEETVLFPWNIDSQASKAF
jgi:hypothetical protein